MTLTIDLSPSEQSRLLAAARLTGLEPAALAKRIVTEHLPMAPQENRAAVSETAREQARVAAICGAQGSLAHIAGTVDDLHRERQTDKQREPSA